jgi:hypothetical protein
MEPNEEISKIAGADKADTQNVQKDLDAQYSDMLKKEQERIEAEKRGITALEFDKFRGLGFATKQDIDESIKGIFGKMVSELEAQKKQNTELREWVMRAKAQGLTGGSLDQKSDNDVSDYLKPFMRGRPLNR